MAVYPSRSITGATDSVICAKTVGTPSLNTVTWQDVGMELSVIPHLAEGKSASRAVLIHLWAQDGATLWMDNTCALFVPVLVNFQDHAQGVRSLGKKSTQKFTPLFRCPGQARHLEGKEAYLVSYYYFVYEIGDLIRDVVVLE